MTQHIRIAVIGGGPVGLATLKTFLENSKPGLKIEGLLFEAKEGVGGSFFFRGYENGTLYSSKELTAFSDFRLPQEAPGHISFSDYVVYLEKYCSHFDLWPYIKLRTHVVRLEHLNGEQWVHRIHYSSATEDGSTFLSSYDCSHIAICTGLQSEPIIPHIPGIENFRGKVYHSADYKGPSQLTGENVVILGSGESAMDIAHESIKAGAATVTMCFRSGFLSFPRVFHGFKLFGKTFRTAIPLDWLTVNLFETAYVHHTVAKARLQWLLSDAVTQYIIWLLTGTRAGYNQYIGQLPLHKWRQVYVNRNDAVLPYINRPYRKANRIFDLIGSCQSTDDVNRRIDTCTFPSSVSPTGCIKFASDTNRKDYERLKFKVVPATTIIYCTGYRPLPSLLPSPSYASCRHIIAPDQPSVAFIGFVRPRVGAIGPIGEMEAMWWLAYLRGDMQHLPTSEPNYTLQSPQTSGLDFGIDYSAYMATLANDIGAKPTLFSLWRQYGLKVLLAYCLGASYVSVYRLTGPFKKKEKMKPIVEGELLNTVKRRGLVGNFFFGLMPLVLFGMLNALALVLETVGLLDSRERGFGGEK